MLEQREQDAAELTAATYAGLPYGKPEFVEPLERAVERPLHRLKPGRKPKAPPQRLRLPGWQLKPATSMRSA